MTDILRQCIHDQAADLHDSPVCRRNESYPYLKIISKLVKNQNKTEINAQRTSLLHCASYFSEFESLTYQHNIRRSGHRMTLCKRLESSFFLHDLLGKCIQRTRDYLCTWILGSTGDDDIRQRLRSSQSQCNLKKGRLAPCLIASGLIKIHTWCA